MGGRSGTNDLWTKHGRRTRRQSNAWSAPHNASRRATFSHSTAKKKKSSSRSAFRLQRSSHIRATRLYCYHIYRIKLRYIPDRRGTGKAPGSAVGRARWRRAGAIPEQKEEKKKIAARRPWVRLGHKNALFFLPRRSPLAFLRFFDLFLDICMPSA